MILIGNGKSKPILEYLPDDYMIESGEEVFTSGKDGIFFAGAPVGTTTENGEVKLFTDPNQLSFVTIDLSNF